MRIKRYLLSLSLRLTSRCLRTVIAFLIKCHKSSGIPGARPIEPPRISIEGYPTVDRNDTFGLEDTQDLVASDELDLRDTMRVTESAADLRGS